MFEAPRWVPDRNTNFRRVEGAAPNTDGSEKIVYKVTDGKHIFAAKIFRQRNEADNSRINRSKRAHEEFNAYRDYRNSAIASYVPIPIDLIHKNGKAIGLLVEWKEGDELRDYYGKRLLPPGMIVELEQRLLTLPNNLWLGEDCMDGYNICLGPQGLWFAELDIARQHKTPEDYRQSVRRWMDILREDYVYR